MDKKSVGFFQNLKSRLGFWFSYHNVDEHYVMKIFGIKLCRKYAVKHSIKQITEYGLTEEKRTPRVIVSLTTFPARINTVHKTITTLLTQDVKPDEVVLWLAEEQFPNRELPNTLTKLQEYGLSIKWCEDIRSFKKLIPSLREYPEDLIITADDDIFYPSDYVGTLYDLYKKNPDCINANRAFVLKWGKEDGKNKYLIKSRSYIYDDTYLPRYANEFMTGYGTIFPPHSLHPDILNKDLFLELMPTNDDVWAWGMAVLNGTKINVNPNGYKLKLYIDRTVQDSGLWKMNMRNSTIGINGSDAVTLLCEKYPKIKERVDSDL